MVARLWLCLLGLFTPLLAAGTQQPGSPGASVQKSQGNTTQTTPNSLKAPPPQGLQAPWDIRQMLSELNAQNAQLKPLLQQMHPQQWLDNGAPPAYASQYMDAQSRMDDQIRAVTNLSQKTESLSAGLDTYFRMEAFEIVARSLVECIQKYGEKNVAQRLSTLIAQEFTNRQKFREYLHDLSTEREQEFKIADAEAQRCRGMISQEPPSPSGTRKVRKK
jgi:hypothetical protein